MTKYKEDYALVVNGQKVLCSDGKIRTAPGLHALMMYNVLKQEPILIRDQEVMPSLDVNDTLGLYATLISTAPGRVRIIHVPQQVQDFLQGVQDVP